MSKTYAEMMTAFEAWKGYSPARGVDEYAGILMQQEFLAFQAGASLHLLGEESKQPAEHLAMSTVEGSASNVMPTIPKWLVDLVNEYGVAGGRMPNYDSSIRWGRLIKGIRRYGAELLAAPAIDRVTGEKSHE